LISEWEKDLQTEFSNPLLSVEDNENLGHLVKVLANRENLVSQAIQQVYSSQTLSGAESIFLDEIHALNGTFREGATFGTGNAVVRTDDTTVNGTILITGSIYSATNSLQYVSTADHFVSSNVTAYELDASTTPLATYNFTVTNITNDQIFSFSATLAATDQASRENFITGIMNNLALVNPSETNISVDLPNLKLYYGLDTSGVLVGLSNTVDFNMDTTLGDRYTLVPVTATTAGFNPLNVGGITNVSPFPTGFVSVTNITKFASGTEIESDAAFSERASVVSNSPRSSTATAVRAALLDRVSGIETVIINKVINAAENDRVEVTPIIIGGTDLDIAVVLEDTQPINNVYFGDIAVSVPTADGETEIIKFSRGTTQQLSVRVSYTTELNTVLTDLEKDAINTNLLNFSEEWNIGDKIFNAQLQSAVFSGTTYGRFTSLVVETKKVEDPEGSYTVADYQAGATELPALLDANISYLFNI
jgi:hypothetical protein